MEFHEKTKEFMVAHKDQLIEKIADELCIVEEYYEKDGCTRKYCPKCKKDMWVYVNVPIAYCDNIHCDYIIITK